jgi:hypothetical protein
VPFSAILRAQNILNGPGTSEGFLKQVRTLRDNAAIGQRMPGPGGAPQFLE